jgi:dUTP pyrophosphatase
VYIKFAKISEDAKMPDRAHSTDAGADLFACLPERLVVAGGEGAVIPTGLKAEVPPGYMLEIKNRSSIAAKRQLLVGACVVDSGYAGEIFINLHNVGSKPQIIGKYEKIAQGVLIPVVCFTPFEVTGDELYESHVPSERGEGSLGSTNKK